MVLFKYMDLVQGLNKHFDIVTTSKTEHDFYMNVYRYFDYIFIHPQLKQLYEKAENDYRKKSIDIWAGYEYHKDNDGDRRSSETFLMERFDMFCHAAYLEGRVYEKIKHYQECDTPDTCGDFYGALLVRGLNFVLKNHKPNYPSLRNRKRDITQTYNNWYKNQRDRYQYELGQFHMMFLVEVEKIELTEVPEMKKFTPFLNLETGDFHYMGSRGNFTISGQEFNVLKTLSESPNYQATYLKLVQSFIPSVERVTSVQKDALRTVIRNIKEKLGVLPKSPHSKKDPFKVIRLYGYKLVIPD